MSDNYFWRTRESDPEIGILERYNHGTQAFSTSVATITTKDDGYYYVKIITLDKPFQFSELDKAMSFTRMWFADSYKKTRM